MNGQNDASKGAEDGASALERLVSRDLRHHFAGPSGAAYWRALCDTREYGHQDLVRFVDESATQIVNALNGREPNKGRFALVSLGPGTGEIDGCLLERLALSHEITRYLGVDASIELLRQTVGRIREGLAFANRFPILAVCGDFTQLSGSLSDPSAERTLFLLTGFTLGNYSESALMAQIGGRMAVGDCLLVDARLHSLDNWYSRPQLGDAERQLLIGAYCSPATLRFVFGPVEALTTATFANASFAYEIGPIATTVPKALNVCIQCTDLRARMRTTGEPVQRARLDLASTTLYDFDSLLSWFSSLTFEPVWHLRTQTMGLVLLKRTN